MIGVFRRIDNVGRVVIPADYRQILKISEGDHVEIIMNDKGEIIVKKANITHK